MLCHALCSQHPHAALGEDWKAANGKGPLGVLVNKAEHEPLCAQVAKKAHGILACIRNTGQQEQGRNCPLVLGTDEVAPHQRVLDSTSWKSAY